MSLLIAMLLLAKGDVVRCPDAGDDLAKYLREHPGVRLRCVEVETQRPVVCWDDGGIFQCEEAKAQKEGGTT